MSSSSPPLPPSLAALIGRIVDERFSLLDERRLANLARLVRTASAGSLVECGVARGGALALMAACRAQGQPVWGFDSFEGMPPITERDRGDGQVWVGVSPSGPLGAAGVDATFDALGIAMDDVHVVAGWFDDTFPTEADRVGTIAVLRLDSDWYEATRLCLDTFYDMVVPGGAVIIDDYNTFTGCREAVDEFRGERGIDAELIVTDEQTEVYWVVPAG